VGSSFWANSVPFAAALAVIPAATAAAVSAEMCGLLLRSGLQEQAAKHGFGGDFLQTGPPQMPFFHFQSEAGVKMMERRLIMQFASECIQRGVWFHPFHTMFLNGAHAPHDIAATLRATDHAFEAVAKAVGDGNNMWSKL
jgi:glutamate-1-semialdehyde 2,1-aminomutase